MKSYQIVREIADINPSINNFLLRCFKHTLGALSDAKGDVYYEWFDSGTSEESLLEKINFLESNGWIVGLTNIVMTQHGMEYLPMLDYSVTHSIETQTELLEKISLFNKSGDVPYKMDGYLIKTNNSYHYLGLHLMTKENFVNFLGSSLLFRHSDQKHFVVDDRWLGHTLKKGFGTIRIGKKEGIYPEVVGKI